MNEDSIEISLRHLIAWPDSAYHASMPHGGGDYTALGFFVIGYYVVLGILAVLACWGVYELLVWAGMDR